MQRKDKIPAGSVETSQDYSSASQTPSPATPMSQIATYVFKNTTATSPGT